MRALQYFFSEAGESLWRNRRAALLSMLTIAAGMFVLGFFLMINTNIQRIVGRWSEAAELPLHLPRAFPWGKAYLNCDSIVRFARVIGAARSGKLDAATFGASVDNFGSLQISTNTNFATELINRATFTILGPRVITAERWDQRGATITQFGETHGGFYWVQGGATWNLMGGIHNQATQIAVGHTAGDGTYNMAGGSINMNGFSTARSGWSRRRS